MSDFDAIILAAKNTTQESQPVKVSQRKSKSNMWADLIPEKEETKRLNLDIPTSTDKALIARAKKLKVTKSALVRRLIDSYLENVE